MAGRRSASAATLASPTAGASLVRAASDPCPVSRAAAEPLQQGVENQQKNDARENSAERVGGRAADRFGRNFRAGLRLDGRNEQGVVSDRHPAVELNLV